MKRTIILNGPPSSGKDTIAKYISEKYGFEIKSFKTPLIESTCYYYGVDYNWFMDGYNQNKELPQEKLGGLTKRKALIHVSENVMKPKHGSDVFGEILALDLENSTKDKFVFSDGGFPEEFMRMKEYDPNTVLIHLHRKGCNFSNDSRNYVPAELANCFFTIRNDNLEKTYQRVDRIMEELV